MLWSIMSVSVGVAAVVMMTWLILRLRWFLVRLAPVTRSASSVIAPQSNSNSNSADLSNSLFALPGRRMNMAGSLNILPRFFYDRQHQQQQQQEPRRMVVPRGSSSALALPLPLPLPRPISPPFSLPLPASPLHSTPLCNPPPPLSLSLSPLVISSLSSSSLSLPLPLPPLLSPLLSALCSALFYSTR